MVSLLLVKLVFQRIMFGLDCIRDCVDCRHVLQEEVWSSNEESLTVNLPYLSTPQPVHVTSVF
jgi:hypothetical protein